MQRWIEIESSCSSCVKEVLEGKLTEDEASSLFEGREALISDAKVLIDYTCRKHGSKNILIIPHLRER